MSDPIRHSSYVPFDPTVQLYAASQGSALIPPEHRSMQPFQYHDYEREMLASHEGCYIHAGLNPAATYYMKGKGALKLLSEVCVNGFENFRVGTGKHGVMCDEEGYIVKDGMVVRLSEDEFLSFWLLPYLEYAERKGDYPDLESTDITGQVFFYQLAGPTSLEIAERVCGEKFDDLKFSNFRMSAIDGHKVMILRMGMAGSLAYEVHGHIEDALYIYERLLEEGKDLGIVKIGHHVYRNVHTEGGFPQQGIHFSSALRDPDYVAFMEEKGLTSAKLHFSGSAGTERYDRAATPIDLNWARLINFDHDFVGKEALRRAVANPPRTTVTLVWNAEDIKDVWASQFGPEPYQWMDLVEDFSYIYSLSDLHADRVLAGGLDVGVSSGRMYSPYDREMISLGIIDPAYAAEGTELAIVWGDPGTRQKEIRCTVGRYPYLDEGGHAK